MTTESKEATFLIVMNQKPQRLVLFDIDGTILLGGPLWKECFLKALHHFHPEFKLPAVSFNGKTDIQIVRELLADSGLNDDEINTSMKEIIDLYVSHAREAVRTRAHEIQVLPGIHEILPILQNHPKVLLGLLTGNVLAGAQVKLQSVGLGDFFKFGVFGDDHWDRYQLPALAVSRVRNLFDRTFSGKEIVIIGDTIHDVNCGKSLGVKSIAVGTGRGVCQDELRAQDPDYYFPDLSAVNDVIDAILE